MGDFNACCGEVTDYIEGVDNLIPRDVIDIYINRNGDLLIDMLVDANTCIVNGRIGSEDFTNINSNGLWTILLRPTNSYIPYQV